MVTSTNPGTETRRPRECAPLLDQVADAVLDRMRPNGAEPIFRTSGTVRGTGFGHETVWVCQSTDEVLAIAGLVRCGVREALHMVGLEDAVHASVLGALADAKRHGTPLAVLGQGEYQQVLVGSPPPAARTEGPAQDRERGGPDGTRADCAGVSPATRRALSLGDVLRRLFGPGAGQKGAP